MRKAILPLAVLAAVALLITGVWGCMGGQAPADAPAPPEPYQGQDPPEPRQREATLVAVGDVMAHGPQINQAYDAATGSYDFSPSFEAIQPYIEDADLAAANLETTLAGDLRDYGGYPMFNAPDGLAQALAEAGFDLVCTANNHSLDSGERGAYSTLETLEEYDLKPFGTARSWAERDRPLYVETDGIRLAFLAYTYGTNGIPRPQGREFVVNRIDDGLMAGDVKRARAGGADLVLVYMHWGQEYQPEQNAQQEEWARELAQAGADVIIGSHPHVVQPAEWLSVEREDGSPHEALVTYSLGNFVSNQHRTSGIPTSDVKYGQLLRLHLEKDMHTGQARVADADYFLSWVQRDQRHRILPLHEAVEEPGQYGLGPAARETLAEGWRRHQQRLDTLQPARMPEKVADEGGSDA